MSAYRSFAIAGGTGNLGGWIVSELVSAGFSVKVLSRSLPSSKIQGAELHTVDFDSEASLVEALAGIEVVINALGPSSLHSEIPKTLAKAAKSAGSKLYVSNDWGSDADFIIERADPPLHPFLINKHKFHDYLEKELHLDWLAINNGIFASVLAMLFGFDKEAGTATIYGKGDTTFSTMTEADVARFVSLAFQHLPASALQNRCLRVVGKDITVNELFEQASKKTGKDWNFKRTSFEDVERDSKDLSLGAPSFFAWALLCMETGSARIVDSDNERVHFTPQDDPVDTFLK